MSKIHKEDLEKLFDNELEEISPDGDWHGFKESGSQPVVIKKSTGAIDRAKEIKKVKKEIKSIRQKKTKRKNGFIDQFLRFTALSSTLALVFFVVMNFPGLSKQFEWLYYNEYLNQELPDLTSITIPTATPTPKPTVMAQVTPEPIITKNKVAPETIDGRLVIDKLKISAPIFWDVDESNIIERLKNGVAHYKGTSRPGEGGNVFIVGHSSNYVWVKSDYNNVFALLDKLVKGDRIEVRFGDVSYYYDVIETKVIKPDQVDALSDTNSEILSLMTCWPVGTTLNRLVVISEFKYSSDWSSQN